MSDYPRIPAPTTESAGTGSTAWFGDTTRPDAGRTESPYAALANLADDPAPITTPITTPSPSPSVPEPFNPVRHVFSVLLCLGLVPAGYFLIDYGFSRDIAGDEAAFASPLTRADTTTSGYVVAGIGVLLLVALLSRLSGLGPLIAGLAFGVLPTAVALIRPLWMPGRIDDLPDLYDHIGAGLTGAQMIVFPITAALLVGLGLTGRWRAR